jgi:hypothetical protein
MRLRRVRLIHPLAPYGSAPNEGAEPQMGAREEWRASPRWGAVKGDGCIVVELWRPLLRQRQRK